MASSDPPPSIVDPPADDRGDAVAGADEEARPPGAWRVLGRAMSPRLNRGQLLAGVLCLALGFAIVAQVRQTNSDDLSTLGQAELVRLLDEVTQRGDALEEQAAALRSQRAELVTGADTERAALEAAQARAEVQGILAGTLAAEGPGVRLVVRQPGDRISALILLNVLEELRNSGAEAIQLNDRRITASSYLVDTATGVQVDGVELTAPYVWLAIGDPDTIIPALEMPGGALATVRSAGGATDTEALDTVVVDAVRELTTPQYATPAPSDSSQADGD